jgi:hypothetical protein
VNARLSRRGTSACGCYRTRRTFKGRGSSPSALCWTDVPMFWAVSIAVSPTPATAPRAVSKTSVTISLVFSTISVTTVVGFVFPLITRFACKTNSFEAFRAAFLAAVRWAAADLGLLFLAAFFLAPFLALLFIPAFFLAVFLLDFLVAILNPPIGFVRAISAMMLLITSLRASTIRQRRQLSLTAFQFGLVWHVRPQSRSSHPSLLRVAATPLSSPAI